MAYPDGPGTSPGGTMPGTTGAIPGIIIGGAIPGNIIPPIWSIRGFLGAGSSSIRPDRGGGERNTKKMKRRNNKQLMIGAEKGVYAFL